MQPRRTRFARRSVLRALGASAAIAPFLPLSRGEAEVGDTPKRLIVFCAPTANVGTYPNKWAPTGGEHDFTLSPILQPLAGGDIVHGLAISDLVPDVLILKGLDLQASYDGPNPGGHLAGIGTLLTGTPLMAGDLFTGGGPDSAGWAGGISIDQFVANALGVDTPFKSLELGVDNFGGVSHLHNVMSYADKAAPLPVESDPYAAFDRIFGGFVAQDPAVLARIRHERQSVIDFVKADLEAAKARIGSEDAVKLDAHLDAVRSIEQRLTGEIADDCEIPTLEQGIDPMQDASFERVGRLQMDMLVTAMSCGLTNVGSIMWGEAPNNAKFDFLPGVTDEEGLHQLTHRAQTDASAQAMLTAISVWYCKQFAYLLERLKRIPEGDGTMLDNTLAVWCSENGNPNQHSRRDMPFVLGGRAGGTLATGRYLTYDGVVHNKLLVSICHAMGLDTDQFGDPAYPSGPLANLG
jgi:hypothetical protein